MRHLLCGRSTLGRPTSGSAFPGHPHPRAEQYVQRFNQPIQQISVLWANLQSAIAGAERIFGLLDTQAEVVDKPDAQAMPAIIGQVAFDHVDAAYNYEAVPHRRDLHGTGRRQRPQSNTAAGSRRGLTQQTLKVSETLRVLVFTELIDRHIEDL